MKEKAQRIKILFKNCPDLEAIYEKIIEIGLQSNKTAVPANLDKILVEGCQSQLFLACQCHDNTLSFFAESEALISKGLAQLLVLFYNDESPETVLTCPPTFLEELGIASALTPSRANGLHHIHLKMKQLALKELTTPSV